MSNYAPANEAGKKPYVVEYTRWGRECSTVVYARDAAMARYLVLGRSGPGEYHRKTRRALSDDLASVEERTP